MFGLDWEISLATMIIDEGVCSCSELPLEKTLGIGLEKAQMTLEEPGEDSLGTT